MFVDTRARITERCWKAENRTRPSPSADPRSPRTGDSERGTHGGSISGGMRARCQVISSIKDISDVNVSIFGTGQKERVPLACGQFLNLVHISYTIFGIKQEAFSFF